MESALYSSMIRGGKTTYFVDVKEAKNGSRFLQLTESQIVGEERKRRTIRVFDESIIGFSQAIAEACHVLGVREGVSL